MSETRTPYEIADEVFARLDTSNIPSFSNDGLSRSDVETALVQAARMARETAAPFAREGDPDKFRDLWTENMPRVSGSMYFSIPGEQPIHLDDDQARRILAMLSEEAR